jgi:hypothetical protein
MERHYCTYFDVNYLARALAMYMSLRRHSPDAVLWALCFDDASAAALSQLAYPGLRPIASRDFERDDDALVAAQAGRSRVEYYFTCSPSWPLYLLREQGMDTLTYVDADYLFFADPDVLWDEMQDASLGIIGHRFPPELRSREAYGRYNVGIIAIRNDHRAVDVLTWWREKCIEWCYDRLEVDRYNDQKYLDGAVERFDDIRVLERKGIGVAPWNWMNYSFDQSPVGPTVDGEPLIAYHYHGLRLYGSRLYDARLARYGRMPRATRAILYGPYLRELRAVETELAKRVSGSLAAAPLRAGNSLPRLALAVLVGDLKPYWISTDG